MERLSGTNLLVRLEWDVPADHVVEKYSEGPDCGAGAFVPVEGNPLRRRVDPSAWNENNSLLLFCTFLKKSVGESGLFLFIFILFTLQFRFKLINIVVVLGIQTRDRRIVGADGSTELWFCSHYTIFFEQRWFAWVAAIAPWFRLRPPSCGPGFESQAHRLRFFQFILLKLYRENSKNKQKDAWIGPFKKINKDDLLSSIPHSLMWLKHLPEWSNLLN